jgi:nucleoside-diphosphate-sugar epimerase
MNIVLIAGGGRTGVLLTRLLVQAGCSVTATVRSDRSAVIASEAGAKTVQFGLDPLDDDHLAAVLMSQAAVVFLAGALAISSAQSTATPQPTLLRPSVPSAIRPVCSSYRRWGRTRLWRAPRHLSSTSA